MSWYLSIGPIDAGGFTEAASRAVSEYPSANEEEHAQLELAARVAGEIITGGHVVGAKILVALSGHAKPKHFWSSVAENLSISVSLQAEPWRDNIVTPADLTESGTVLEPGPPPAPEPPPEPAPATPEPAAEPVPAEPPAPEESAPAPPAEAPETPVEVPAAEEPSIPL